MEIFGENVRLCMEAKGINADTLAKETGIPGSTLHGLLHGREPKARQLLTLARHFDVSMEYLLLGNSARDSKALKVQEEQVEYKADQNKKLREILEKAEELRLTVERVAETSGGE